MSCIACVVNLMTEADIIGFVAAVVIVVVVVVFVSILGYLLFYYLLYNSGSPWRGSHGLILLL